MQPEPVVVQSLLGRRAHQRDCVSMANELRQLRVVPKPQREHVGLGFALDKDDTGDDLVSPCFSSRVQFMLRFTKGRNKKVYYAPLPYLRCMSPPGRGYS
jgi:hypothetical protein